MSIAQTDEEYDYASLSKSQTSKIYRKVIYHDHASFFKRQNEQDTPSKNNTGICLLLAL